MFFFLLFIVNACLCLHTMGQVNNVFLYMSCTYGRNNKLTLTFCFGSVYDMSQYHRNRLDSEIPRFFMCC